MHDPINSVKELISNVSDKRLLQLQKLSNYHATDVDWAAHNSRVLENLLRESYNIPCKSFEFSVCVMTSTNYLDKARCGEHFKTEHKTTGLKC